MIVKLSYLLEVITIFFYTYFVENKESVKCVHCGSEEAYIIHDDKYNGLRGHCPNCGANWPES